MATARYHRPTIHRSCKRHDRSIPRPWQIGRFDSLSTQLTGSPQLAQSIVQTESDWSRSSLSEQKLFAALGEGPDSLDSAAHVSASCESSSAAMSAAPTAKPASAPEEELAAEQDVLVSRGTMSYTHLRSTDHTLKFVELIWMVFGRRAGAIY